MTAADTSDTRSQHAATLEDVAERLVPSAPARADSDPEPVDPLGPYNAVGEFPDGLAARDGVRAIETSGIDGFHISVRPVRSTPQRSREDLDPVDRRLGRDLGRAALPGLTLGAAAGLVLGLAAYALLDLTASAAVATIIAAFAVGAGLGAMFTVLAHTASSQQWQESFHADAGSPVLVSVETDDAVDATELGRALEDAHARRVWVVDDHADVLTTIR